MTATYLPSRPRPEAGESLDGYLLRVADANGFVDSVELLRLIGLKGTLCRYTRGDPSTLLGRLAPWVRSTPEALEVLFDANPTPWSLNETRTVQELRVRSPRVCPACLSTGVPLHAAWTIVLTTRCDVHPQPLQSHCPQCRTPYTWRTDLLRGCPACHVPWSNLVQSDHGWPEHQRVWQRLRSLPAMDADWLWDLSLALRVAARPFDLWHQPLAEVTATEGLADLMDRAWALLNDRAAQEACCVALNEHHHALHPLGMQAVYGPLQALQAGLHKPWPLTTFTPPPLSTSEQVSVNFWDAQSAQDWLTPRRLSCASNNEALQAQVTGYELAHCLGLGFGAVDRLVAANLLHPLNPTRVARDQLFDLHEAVPLVIQIPESSPDPEAFTRLSDGDVLLKRHACSYDIAVAWVLAHRITAYRPQGQTDLSSLWIERTALRGFLRDHLRRECQEPLAVQRACQVLGIGPKRLRGHTKAGHFQLAHWGSNAERVDGSSFWNWIVKQRGYMEVGPHVS